MKRTRLITIIATALSVLAIAGPVWGAGTDLGLGYAGGIGLSTVDIRTIIAGMIRSFMGLLGIVLVLQIMWGGFLMMTHGDNEDRKSKAVGTIKSAIIGMIIIMSSASMARFVIDAIMNATGAAFGGSHML